MMRTVLLAHVAAMLCLGTPHAPARADGGTVRVVQQHGAYRISVFTAPNPLRAGPIDVSVLVQDLKTGEPLTDCETWVTLTPAGRGGTPIQAPATTEAATNKLLRSAMIELPTPGEWQVRVTSTAVGHDLETQFTVTAAPALPRWLTQWPWFTWPAVAVLMFVVHRRLVARRRQLSTTAKARGSRHSGRFVTGTNFCARSP